MSGDKSQEQNSSSTEFIERRRAALERYLNRTAAHPVLSIDPDFREFLEAGKKKMITYDFKKLYIRILINQIFQINIYLFLFFSK